MPVFERIQFYTCECCGEEYSMEYYAGYSSLDDCLTQVALFEIQPTLMDRIRRRITGKWC